MANAKISNAAVFVPPSPPIDPATVFAAELSGANSGPTMAGIKTTVLSGTYHDVTSSRALDVTYTNTQPVPMFLSLTITASPGQANLFIGGVFVGCAANGSTSYIQRSVYGFVNPGEAYELTNAGGAALNVWVERY